MYGYVLGDSSEKAFFIELVSVQIVNHGELM